MNQQWYDDLSLFTALALSDTMLGHSPDLLYLFSETDDNRESVLAAARAVSRIWDVDIAIPDNFTNPGYSGFLEWGMALRQQPFLRTANVFAILVLGNLNTMSEAKAMVRYACEHGMRTVGIVAPAFHMPRAFLSAISVVVRECLDIKVYALPGRTPDWWHKEVNHSQGTTSGTRVELIAGERKRIARYQKEGDYYPGGDLISFHLAFEYLRTRDRNARS